VRFDGEALKRLREAKGLSQRQLAIAAGVDAGAISRLEAGIRTDPTAITVGRIGLVLGPGSFEEMIHE
jgi:transcriptional regulator with XRE-family HTH domain